MDEKNQENITRGILSGLAYLVLEYEGDRRFAPMEALAFGVTNYVVDETVPYIVDSTYQELLLDPVIVSAVFAIFDRYALGNKKVNISRNFMASFTANGVGTFAYKLYIKDLLKPTKKIINVSNTGRVKANTTSESRAPLEVQGSLDTPTIPPPVIEVEVN